MITFTQTVLLCITFISDLIKVAIETASRDGILEQSYTSIPIIL
jgi:hypothetical protein